MKKPDDDIVEIQQRCLSDIRTQYLLAVRRAVMSEKGSAEYWENRGVAKGILDKVFILFGFDVAEGLQEDGFVEWNRTRAKGVTLAGVLSLLRPNENVFITRRISQHEDKAIGGGRVQGLQGGTAGTDSR